MRRDAKPKPVQPPFVRLFAVLAVVVAAACAPPGPSTTADDLQPAGLGAPALAARFMGCWVLAWTPEAGDASVRDAFALPDSVSLRDGPMFGSRERLVSPATEPEGRMPGASGPRPWEDRFRVNRWWVESDSLRIRFSDGADDQWHVHLGLDGSGATGWAAAGANPERAPRARADVLADRIECAFG